MILECHNTGYTVSFSSHAYADILAAIKRGEFSFVLLDPSPCPESRLWRAKEVRSALVKQETGLCMLRVDCEATATSACWGFMFHCSVPGCAACIPNKP